MGALLSLWVLDRRSIKVGKEHQGPTPTLETLRVRMDEDLSTLTKLQMPLFIAGVSD